jgi:hypothetical protein
MDALATCERFNAMILHSATNNLHTYYVLGGYHRFVLDAGKTETNVPEAEAVSRAGEA